MSGNIGGDEDPRNEEELKQYLLDRIARLESRNMELKEHARQLDIEKKNIESQKIRYEREIRKLKSEIEKTAINRNYENRVHFSRDGVPCVPAPRLA